MKKGNALWLFFRVFLKSVLLIAVLGGVCYGSYELTMRFYKAEEDAGSEKAREAIIDLVNDVPVEKIAKNMIFSVDEKTDKINRMVLEIFNAYTGNLDYITIPVNTQFAISNELYQKTSSLGLGLPQIITLSEINQYLTGEERYPYALSILEDLLGTKIHYYTILKKSDFTSIFKTKKMRYTYTKNKPDSAGDGKTGDVASMIGKVQVFSEDFQSQVQKLDSISRIEAVISEWHEKSESNLPLKSKLNSAPDYQMVKPEYIHYWSIYGEDRGDYFLVSQNESSRLIQEIENNTSTYMEAQESEAMTEEAQEKNSIGKNIRILNGSSITGLASAYRDKLSADGYTIVGIGNYKENNLVTTKIIAREENMGTDLLQYFNNAEIVTSELSDGTDIQIILGAGDKL